MNKTVLIVDDLASVRLYHANFLKHKGYRCLSAKDGAEALAALRAHPVDLILLDMVMPGMSGPAFAVELAADPALASVPVLAITSAGSLAEAAFGNGPRPVRVLSKPVLPEALYQCVEALLHPGSRPPATQPASAQ